MLGPIFKSLPPPSIVKKAVSETGTEANKPELVEPAHRTDRFIGFHDVTQHFSPKPNESGTSLKNISGESSTGSDTAYPRCDEYFLPNSAAIPNSEVLFGSQDFTTLRSIVIDGVQPVAVSSVDTSTPPVECAVSNLQCAIDFRSNQPVLVQPYYQPQVSLAQDRLVSIVETEVSKAVTEYPLQEPHTSALPISEKRVLAAADIVASFAEQPEYAPLVFAAAKAAISNLEASRALH